MLRRISKTILLGWLFFPLISFAGLVNINIADSTELQTLNGIGPTYAQRIIDYRNTNGPFQKIDDIKDVSGIGDSTYNKIKDYITVGDVVSGVVQDTIMTNATSTTSQASTTSSVSQNAIRWSSHYSVVSINEEKPSIRVTVNVGRDRLTTTGSVLEFKAETNLKNSGNIKFNWNFGDGGVATGENVKHIYEFPGNYVVVLNLYALEGDAVARVNVRVIEPRIRVVSADDQRIEIRNDSSDEVNLFGRAVVSNGDIFVFPQDTIIPLGETVSFGTSITKLRPADVSQVQILELRDLSTPDIRYVVEGQKLAQIRSIESKLAILRQQLASIKEKNLVAPTSTIEISSSQTAAVLEGIKPASTTTSRGWFRTIERFLFRTR